MRAKDVLGRSGEQAAAEYLESAGLRILDRNWRCAVGEIDVVAAGGDVLVVCEVKARRGERFGSPLEAVTPAKAARLYRLGAEWAVANGYSYARLRVDVVSIVLSPGGGRQVRHVAGAC
jgi:putative endonuclease